MQCISTASFSILVNGSPFGFFTSSRGLRQGDPLSPYLFILSMEIISRMLNLSESLNYLKGIKLSRNNTTINHLLFVDNLLIITRASPFDATNCNIILDVFNSWSGLQISYHKSGIPFSRFVRGSSKRIMKNNLNMKKLGKDTKYLGNQLFIKRKKKESFQFLIEKIQNKLTS